MTAARVTFDAADTGDQQLVAATSSLVLMGLSAGQTAGAAGTLVLRHGTGASDDPIIYVDLASGASNTYWFGPDGISCPNGIYLERLTGTTAIAVYWSQR